MTSTALNTTGEYQPRKTIELPPIYAWPPKPLKALKYLVLDMLFPWGYLWILLGFAVWYWLMPPLARMVEFEPGWIVQIWLRNALLLTAVAGGLHWWLYRRRGQGRQYKFHDQWLEGKNSELFLWGNQVWDNMFWSIVSGVTICSLYEAVTFWIYANGYRTSPTLSDHPIYIVICLLAVFFWGTIHFYCVHRFMHLRPVYRIVHELHHRNVVTGPWSGIAMHPIEHLLYFSVFLLVWIVPVHPVVVITLSLFMSLGPAPSHSGFNFIEIKGYRIFTGDWYHQLHHQYFNFNYGNTNSPLDKLFGSWHDGSPDSLQRQRNQQAQRRRRQRQRGV